MESIKETELNLQRQVVTTVPNTWLVEAVNPSTGEKKMINIANYASVVAGVMFGVGTTQLPAGSDFLSLNAGSYNISGTDIGSMLNGPAEYTSASRLRVFVVEHANTLYQTIFMFNNTDSVILVAKKNGPTSIRWYKLSLTSI